MNRFTNIQIALDTQLNLVPDNIPIAWENTAFTPVKGQAWLRPTLMNGNSSTLDLASRQLNPGIYRIDAFYPLDNGPRDLLIKLDAIFNAFKVTALQAGLTVLFIRNISIKNRIVDSEWLTGSIDINFDCYDDSVPGSWTPAVGNSWILINTNITVSPKMNYIPINNSSRIIFTLPTNAQVGDYFRIAGYGNAGWQIGQPAGMFITDGDESSSVGASGSLGSTNARDSVELVCVSAGIEFQVLSSQGNLSII